jgi:hypothetical protein
MVAEAEGGHCHGIEDGMLNSVQPYRPILKTSKYKIWSQKGIESGMQIPI